MGRRTGSSWPRARGAGRLALARASSRLPHPFSTRRDATGTGNRGRAVHRGLPRCRDPPAGRRTFEAVGRGRPNKTNRKPRRGELRLASCGTRFETTGSRLVKPEPRPGFSIVANLFLVRGEGRRREIALRTALGASRGDIVQYFLAESVALSALGGVVGVGVAAVALRALVALRPSDIPRLAEVG
jgi:FtsX-like permease family